MTEPARKLRRADELQLRVVLAALRRGGRFVIVVADEETWPEAREVLARGLTPPPLHEVRLVTGEDVIRLFSSPEVAGEGADILHVGDDAAGAIEALNLHRDKLRQKRCRFALRLDGTAVHERFVREAPDCYSFRDAVANVAGRPAAAPLKHNQERLEPVREQFENHYAHILGKIRDSYGIDVDAARQALTITREARAVDLQQVMFQLVQLATALVTREDVNGAREAFSQVVFPWWGALRRNELLNESVEADILINEGRWEESERRLRTSLATSAQAENEYWFARFASMLTRLLAWRGELEAALEIVVLMPSNDSEPLRIQLECFRGEPDAIVALAAPFANRLPGAEEISETLGQVRTKAEIIRRAFSAGLVDLSRRAQLDAELESLAAHVAAVASVDPPWSRIAVELLLADNLLARTGAEDMARAAAQRALALARTGAPEQIPNCVRRIAVAALRTGAIDGLADLLDEAFTAAEARHLPGEAARLAALRLWHLARLGQDTTQAEQALNAAIDRTGSVLVEAEVLYLAGRGTGRRDLLERSRRIYRSLPWPQREGECLEALGMKAAARTRYETFGLRLAALALDRRTEPPPIVA
ncbi:MAG TPA: hypothetical protein VLS89_18460 [Candidatus Nanopelagicales bacterium]|nr:hypothetical protein [Candidatus Nanopelagicales bacterium]